jgi:hypothetical protein
MRLSKSFNEGPYQQSDKTIPHFSPCVLGCFQILDVDSGAEHQDFMLDKGMEYEYGQSMVQGHTESLEIQFPF